MAIPISFHLFEQWGDVCVTNCSVKMGYGKDCLRKLDEKSRRSVLYLVFYAEFIQSSS